VRPGPGPGAALPGGVSAQQCGTARCRSRATRRLQHAAPPALQRFAGCRYGGPKPEWPARARPWRRPLPCWIRGRGWQQQPAGIDQMAWSECVPTHRVSSIMMRNASPARPLPAAASRRTHTCLSGWPGQRRQQRLLAPAGINHLLVPVCPAPSVAHHQHHFQAWTHARLAASRSAAAPRCLEQRRLRAAAPACLHRCTPASAALPLLLPLPLPLAASSQPAGRGWLPAAGYLPRTWGGVGGRGGAAAAGSAIASRLWSISPCFTVARRCVPCLVPTRGPAAAAPPRAPRASFLAPHLRVAV
jgi:hypothetical protein